MYTHANGIAMRKRWAHVCVELLTLLNDVAACRHASALQQRDMTSQSPGHVTHESV